MVNMGEKVPLRTKKEVQDDSIMGTNNSSIVSKRSVERLYYPEPHFFRFFVNKPQRRSPLINRGYWLRMHAVDHVVRQFLEEPSEKRKVVVNLGCGYDPLPFQCLARYPSLCQGVKFVDVDYMQLMIKKCEIIERTDQIRQLLTNAQFPSPGDLIALRSDQYLALGCDLRDVEKLSKVLAEGLDLADCLVLCTAEVSITYMDVQAADALIRWAATLNHARFCLLEQFFPDGPDHPFAKTMIEHFDKLRTPLRGIDKYPSLQHQRQRYLGSGWDSVAIRSLWDLWADPQFLGSGERVGLDRVEPFDEWEEFVLFASHYFILVAAKGAHHEASSNVIGPHRSNRTVHSKEEETVSGASTEPLSLVLQYEDNSKGRGRRRFGAVFKTADDLVGHHGGQGPQSRLDSTDLYSGGANDKVFPATPVAPVTSRMCHSITSLDKQRSLLVGGRTSPGNAMGDCWLHHKQSWERVQDLPSPRYRHCAAQVFTKQDHPGVLVSGGKDMHGLVLEDYIIWSTESGWQPVQVIGASPRPRFGASMAASDRTSGILLGGMTEDGFILSECWRWSIGMDDGTVTIRFWDASPPKVLSSELDVFLARFGASIESSPLGLLLIGGVSDRGLIPHVSEIMLLRSDTCKLSTSGAQMRDTFQPERAHLVCHGPRPLLVGHSVTTVDTGKLLILGGGAVCFSFGAYWNMGVWTVQNSIDISTSRWRLCTLPEAVLPSRPVVAAVAARNVDRESRLRDPRPRALSRVRLASRKAFDTIVTKASPVIIEGLDIGSCTRLWTEDYLRDNVGADRQVVVHEASTDEMNFQAKNFRYVTKAFGDFLDQITEGQRQYLRSLASEKPAAQPAQLIRDFPEIAEDFTLPPELALVIEQAHSSPLRISGPVALWLHYDVMANVLCQIRGTKRLILYPPSDVTRLHFPAGASSSVLSHGARQNLANTHPCEAVLHAGDVLYIPPCWPHTALPTAGVSVAVNVFFRNLPSGYATGKDVYGNRDLHAYEKGRADVDKIARAFKGLPTDIGKFYLERLAEELMEKARRFGSTE